MIFHLRVFLSGLALLLIFTQCAPPERSLRRMALKWELNPDGARLHEVSIEINATPEKIWKVITEPNEWPKWHPQVSRARSNDRVRGGSSFIWEHGKKHHSDVIQDEKPFRIIWFSRALTHLSLTRWTIEPTGKNSSKVSLGESRDGFFLYLSLSPEEHQKELQDWLTYLKKEVEKEIKE